MQKVFRFIKRKRNLRRLSAVWLCLVFIELFCPIICDEPTFAAQDNIPKTEITASIEGKNENLPTFISACNHQESGNHEQPICNDECLCHANVITNLSFLNFRESPLKSLKIAFHYGKPLFNSLSPPFQPPKNS